jgi:DNA-binding SARP family transcriptional activator/tetratricopeptide (TPR) repeat protein
VLQEVKFAVLGPVRAWRGDTELNLGAPQQRAVLALLLLADGRQVTLDGLINGLWGDDPPAAAVGAVRTYVSRLRRALDAGSGDSSAAVIESAGTGYVVRVAPGALDLDLFERMAADARALEGGDLREKAQAAALLRDALRLVQGEPLADIPGPYARWQRVRITELQLAVSEDRLALEIDLGGHAAAAVELQTLLADYPVRERISELLMLALYRSGRQIDALAIFDNARRLLAEEFGVDPGPALQEMQQRILQTDESLITSLQHMEPPQESSAAPDGPSAPLPAPVPAVPVVPAQLPADLPVFAGRRRELARLDMLIADEANSSAAVTIAAIDGMAGIGKSALAVHWGYQVAERFPDGQLYVNLRGFDPSGAPMTPGEALRGFLQALGVAPQRIPDDLDAQASLYRSMLHGRRILVLLDNAYDMTQARPLLPGSPGCLVIVTSRNRLLGLVTAHGAGSVTLEALPVEEARETLAARLGAARFTAEPHALEEILDYCSGLPLAIAVVAARATIYGDFSLRDIASELRDADTRLDALSTDDAAADVRAVFSWSYQLLTESARRLFRLLSVHSGPDVSSNAVASVAGLPKAEVLPLLAELTGARLLTEHRPGRFASHDLTRVYAAGLSAAHDTPGDRRAALGRLLDYYLSTSHSAHLLLRPSFAAPQPDAPRPGVVPEVPSDCRHAMAWFDAERQVLQAAVGYAAQHRFRGHAWQLALTLQQFYQRQGYWYDWAATMRAALAAALDADDPSGQAHIRRSLAAAYHLLAQETEAIAELERARELSGHDGHPVEQAYLHSIFGAIFARQGSSDTALAHYRQARACYQAVDHRTGQANALMGIGGCFGQQGRYGDATSLVHDAMAIYGELEDPDGQGDCWLRLGEFHHALGEHEQALTCHQRAVTLMRGSANRAGEALALDFLGDSALAAGKQDLAREAWQTALIVLNELGLPAAGSVRRKLHQLQTPGTAPSKIWLIGDRRGQRLTLARDHRQDCPVDTAAAFTSTPGTPTATPATEAGATWERAG